MMLANVVDANNVDEIINSPDITAIIPAANTKPVIIFLNKLLIFRSSSKINA